MGQGKVVSWVTTSPTGVPSVIGVTFTRSVLKGLPGEITGYPVALPVQARRTGFDHVELDWRPHGHIPPGIYDAPHVDFHFYLITAAVQDSITAVGDDLARVQKKPASDAFVPDGYIAAPGGEEAKMGAHWVDPKAPEFNGQPFTHSFIYGFYDGKMAFIEPMIDLQYLLAGTGFTQAVAVPERYPKPGYFPTSYGMTYDPKTDKYTVFLGGLTKR
jgi:hypothetical protein